MIVLAELLLVCAFLSCVGYAMFDLLGNTLASIGDFLRQRRERRRAARTQRQADFESQLRQSKDQHQRQIEAVQRNREMQLAILQLGDRPDPDFRRAALAMRAGQVVPAHFRQKQFVRLRPLVVRHYISCRQRGSDLEVLFASLVELVAGFGMPDFEADYIRDEAERTLESRASEQGDGMATQFQARLMQFQRSHEQRMDIIRSLPNLSEDVRAQLLEAEEQRFQTQLFGRRAL